MTIRRAAWAGAEPAYGHNPEIRAYAQKDLPTLQKHKSLSWQAKETAR